MLMAVTRIPTRILTLSSTPTWSVSRFLLTHHEYIVHRPTPLTAPVVTRVARRRAKPLVSAKPPPASSDSSDLDSPKGTKVIVDALDNMKLRNKVPSAIAAIYARASIPLPLAFDSKEHQLLDEAELPVSVFDWLQLAIKHTKREETLPGSKLPRVSQSQSQSNAGNVAYVVYEGHDPGVHLEW